MNGEIIRLFAYSGETLLVLPLNTSSSARLELESIDDIKADNISPFVF